MQYDVKAAQLHNWKLRMQNMHQKAEWLNRKGFNHTPTVDDGSNRPSSKTGDADALWSYWHGFWKNQKWSEEEKLKKKEETLAVLKPITSGLCNQDGRPKLELFRKRIKAVKGCPGYRSKQGLGQVGLG